jgi:hypothetical protein
MTSTVATRRTDDVFASGGEVHLVMPDATVDRPALGAISFVAHSGGDLRAARRACLGRAFDALKITPGDTRLFVSFVADDSTSSRMRPPSRIFEEKKIVFASPVLTEVFVLRSKTAKWFAEFAVDPDRDLEAVDAALFAWSVAFVLAGIERPMIHALLDGGWPPAGPHFLRDCALAAADRNAFIVRITGAFDDPEASADIVGPTERVRRLGFDQGSRSGKPSRKGEC